MRNAFKCLLLAAVMVFAGIAAFAQVTTSSLGGRVVDQNGEPVIGAAVVAIHEPSAFRHDLRFRDQRRRPLHHPGYAYRRPVPGRGFLPGISAGQLHGGHPPAGRDLQPQRADLGIQRVPLRGRGGRFAHLQVRGRGKDGCIDQHLLPPDHRDADHQPEPL